MAVYTKVPDAALADFLGAYGLPPATLFKGIAEGVENSNYLVEAGGRRLILTLYERRVAASDLPYFLALMDHVADAGVPAARPLMGDDGERLRTLCGRPAALIGFVEGVSPDRPTEAQARAAGRALGRLHAATAGFGRSRPNGLGTEAVFGMTDALAPRLDEITPGLAGYVGEAVSLLRRRLAAIGPDALPAGTIHADLFPDNVLMTEGRVTGLIDFYFACTDHLAYDVAVAMNAWMPEPGAGPGADEAPDEANADALLAGYEAVRPLSPPERAALPTLRARAALRFLVTRAHDWLHRVPGAEVTMKDPLPYARLLRHHLGLD